MVVETYETSLQQQCVNAIHCNGLLATFQLNLNTRPQQSRTFIFEDASAGTCLTPHSAHVTLERSI